MLLIGNLYAQDDSGAAGIVTSPVTTAEQDSMLANIPDEPNWLTFEEAAILHSLEPRKVLIYVVEEGNEFCDQMDTSTFSDRLVNYYLQHNYYPVKMDARMKDTVLYRGRQLIYRVPPGQEDGYHDLVSGLLEGKYTFPAMIVLNEERVMKRLRITNGYINAYSTGNMLGFYAHDAHLKKDAVSFGQVGDSFKCTNPNHPHNRLRQQVANQQQQLIIKDR